jgi:sugar/nucleoside kinase (ribokinase family)
MTSQNKQLRSFDVVGLGLCILDMVGLGKYYPDEDQKMTLDKCDWQGGGPAATAVATAHRLGARCSFVGQLGLDFIGQRILQELKDEGIEVDAVQVYHDELSCYAFSFTSRGTGSRTMFLNLNRYWNTYQLDERSRWRIAHAKVLCLDRHEIYAGIEALRSITNPAGIPSVFDPSTREHETTEEALSLVTYPIVPRDFIKRFTKKDDLNQGARMVLGMSKHADVVIVTLGARGCLCVTRKLEKYYPAFQVKVKDTLGAGDVFHGAFCYGLLHQGWSLEKRIQFATATAALKCRHVGGRRGIPRLKMVKTFLAKQGMSL